MLYPSITDLPDAEASPLRVEAATAVALVSGILLAALGLLRLGALAHAIPPAVMVGFTAAAALAIGVSQAKELLGLKVPRYPYTWQTCSYVLGHLGEAQPASAVRCCWLWVCGFVVVGGGCLSTPPSLPDDTHASTKHPPKNTQAVGLGCVLFLLGAKHAKARWVDRSRNRRLQQTFKFLYPLSNLLLVVVTSLVARALLRRGAAIAVVKDVPVGFSK